MEEIRDDCINNLVAMMQAAIRAYYARRIYNRLWKHKMGLLVAQRTIRGYMIGKTWPWWSLWLVSKHIIVRLIYIFLSGSQARPQIWPL